ncbi:hypothetical protein CLV62_1372 [Dysgonomonas alginatilytica]|uniref:YD repeat-containing protein n=1 Tax=Dysgonomonas alginatilytica TaxID=1605892 RepID=A0A2V3PKV8_9BACT|nr:hypothetical protein [Dysgonomonas alginatilytica]PXV59336.1 hypothetical protein CLV62_1372 [Dysgonomonas alginatilytica]
MKKTRIYILITVLIISNLQIIAQSTTIGFPKLSSLQPIEPTTASLGRYGEYKMDNSNGQPDISIPLYEIRSGDLRIPIILNYQSGGIKVSQEATWVGLGWDLFYGGQLTRVVNGFPDELESTDRPNALDIRNYINKNLDNPYDDYLKELSSGRQEYSFMPDEYYYNIGLENGKYIGKDVEALIPYKPIKISSSEDFTAIADANGTVFTFGGTQETTKPLTAAHNYPSYISAWYLNEIRSANNHTIRYVYQYDGEYNGNETGYYEGAKLIRRQEGLGNSYSLTRIPLTRAGMGQIVKSSKPQYIYFNGGRISFELTSREDIVYPSSLKKLSSITIEVLSSNNTYTPLKKIQFDYSYKSNRLFLNKVSEIADNTIKIVAEFEYNENLLPKKESFSYDYCGYYNGNNVLTPIATQKIEAGNKSLVIGGADKSASPSLTQAGVLTGIKHPTGGKTIYKWGNHHYGEGQPIDGSNYEPKRTVSVQGYFDKELLLELDPDDHLRNLPGPHPYGSTEYVCDRSQTVEVTYSVSSQFIEDQSMHQKYDRGGVGIIDKTTNNVLLDYSNRSTASVNHQTVDITFIAGRTYLIYATTNCKNVISFIEFKYLYQPPPEEIPARNYLYFGLRIEEIENYDSDSRLIEKSVFSYLDPADPKKSSGYLTSTEPIRLSTQKRMLSIFGSMCESTLTEYKYYYNRPITGIYPNGVNYEYVQVRNEKLDKTNNGIIQYRFKKAYDPEYGTDVPKVSASDERGKLLEESVYDTQNKLVQNTNYFYKDDSRIKKVSTGFKLLKYLDMEGGCSGVDPEYYLDDMYIPVNYSYYSTWSRPDSIVKYTYIDTKNYIKNKTEYTYDDIISCLPTKTTESTSIDKKKRITNNKYPSQLTDAVSQKMTEKNIINQFIIKEELTDNILINRQTNKYSIKLLDKNNNPWFYNRDLACMDSIVIQYSTSLPITKLKIPIYDNFNNILQYETTTKSPYTYLWGYGGQYPIAEIQNATYAEVVQKLTQVLIDRVAQAAVPADADLQQIKALTTSIPTALITTYTYKPLVGMLTATNPREVTTYHEYDTFGRLKATYIQEKGSNVKKLLQSYDYHYQNQ